MGTRGGETRDKGNTGLTAPVYAIHNNTLWRLNFSILNNEQFVVRMKTEIKHYLKENDNREVSPSVLWDACKAVLRGK